MVRALCARAVPSIAYTTFDGGPPRLAADLSISDDHQLLGGQLEYTTAPEKGTRFFFTLDLPAA